MLTKSENLQYSRCVQVKNRLTFAIVVDRRLDAKHKSKHTIPF